MPAIKRNVRMGESDFSLTPCFSWVIDGTPRQFNRFNGFLEQTVETVQENDVLEFIAMNRGVHETQLLHTILRYCDSMFISS